MSLTAVLVILLVCVGFPAVIGFISVICDRVTYGNWIWKSKRKQ